MRWVPLEANPEVFQEWTASLGLKPEDASFCDIYGLDPDLLAFVPRPVYAVIQLFPASESYWETRKKMDDEQKDQPLPKNIMFFKQTIGNACGTMGILHAVANIPVKLDPSSALAKIFSDCKDLSPAERGKYLETCTALEAAHTATAQGGQTAAPDANDDAPLHFSAFVAADIDGQRSIVELDGGRRAPIVHGPLKGDLLEGVAEIAKKSMAMTDDVNFSLIALTKPAEA